MEKFGRFGDRTTARPSIAAFTQLHGSMDLEDDSFPTETELLANVDSAEDVEPNFDVVQNILEVQADPLLGYGAFGTVHYAVLIAESKTVALKAISKAATRKAAVEGGSSASLREILFGEALLLEELAIDRHRNMLKFHGWWHDTNHVFIAQQLCVGGELPEWLNQQPVYTEKLAAKVTYDLLQALTYCHGANVVHRDIKPQNLLFTTTAHDAYLKLADWGLATRWSASSDPPLSEYCGTLDYASPEMLEGSYTPTTDVWSAGVILHLLLTGGNPFRGPSKAATEHRVRTGTFTIDDAKGWAGVSEPARAMAKLLLSPSTERPTAKAALKHEWLNQRKNEGAVSLNQQIPTEMIHLCELSGWADKAKDSPVCMQSSSRAPSLLSFLFLPSLTHFHTPSLCHRTTRSAARTTTTTRPPPRAQTARSRARRSPALSSGPQEEEEAPQAALRGRRRYAALALLA